MTLPTSTSSSCARKPIIENITKPAKNDVKIFEIATINASLKIKRNFCYNNKSDTIVEMKPSR